MLATMIAALVTVVGQTAEPFRIARGRMPEIAVGDGMRRFVSRAAEDVAGDMEKIFGVRPDIVPLKEPAENAIVLSKAGHGWENYSIESGPGNVLKITGSDDRGVLFGLYRSRQTAWGWIRSAGGADASRRRRRSGAGRGFPSGRAIRPSASAHGS